MLCFGYLNNYVCLSSFLAVGMELSIEKTKVDIENSLKIFAFYYQLSLGK
jgi:hypothetical protein